MKKIIVIALLCSASLAYSMESAPQPTQLDTLKELITACDVDGFKEAYDQAKLSDTEKQELADYTQEQQNAATQALEELSKCWNKTKVWFGGYGVWMGIATLILETHDILRPIPKGESLPLYMEALGLTNLPMILLGVLATDIFNNNSRIVSNCLIITSTLLVIFGGDIFKNGYNNLQKIKELNIQLEALNAIIEHMSSNDGEIDHETN